MKSKIITSLFLLITFIGLSGCVSTKASGDVTRIVTLKVSPEAGTYMTWYSPHPLPCMLIKENNQDNYHKVDIRAIKGFQFESGYAYTLKVSKTILANPPADASNIVYKLLKIKRKRAVTLQIVSE